MTLLSVIQDAAPYIGIDVPDQVMAATNRDMVEMKSVFKAMARRIAISYPWQKLATIATYTGDGSTEDFSLPSDFDWMPDDNQVWVSDNDTAIAKVMSQDEWLGLTVRDFSPTPSCWIIYGGQIHFKDALANTITAKHFYQSNLINDPASGSNSATFTLDTDTFVLDEELLRLAIIYRWKQLKGQPYAEEMNDYEERKEKLIARDKGATILKAGGFRMPRGATLAYPGSVPTS